MNNDKNNDKCFNLVFKNKATNNDTQTKNKKENNKNKKSNPFQKGSWKAWFWKKLTKYKSSKNIEDFHFIKSQNIILYKNEKMKAQIFNKKLSDSEIKKLTKKYPNAVLLINYDGCEFTRISLSAYCKLLKIKNIMISFKIDTLDENDDKYYMLYENELVIDNINELMSFISDHRHGINGVYELQCHCCWYSVYRYHFKILVVNQDGTTNTFKSENKFMENYGLKLF